MFAGRQFTRRQFKKKKKQQQQIWHPSQTGPQPETQSEVHQRGGTHCDVSVKLLKGGKDKVVTSEQHCAGSAAHKTMLRSHALARKCWAGNQSSVAACQSSQSAAEVPFLPLSQVGEWAKWFSNYRLKAARKASCHFKRWVLGNTDTFPSVASLPSAKYSWLSCCLRARQPTAYTIYDRLKRFLFRFFCLLFQKACIAVLENGCVLCAATEVGMTSGSRSRRRRRPSCPRMSRCRKRRSRPSPERTNSSHRSQVGVWRAAVRSPTCKPF